MRWILKHGSVVTPMGLAPVDIVVEDETIVWVGVDCDPSEGDMVVDLAGLYVLPGFVDMHTHLHLRVGQYSVADDFQTGTAAALAGGTTTVVEYVTPDPGETFTSALDRWRRVSEKSRADYAFHVCIPRVTDDVLDELPGLIRQGITGFKVFLAYPDRLMLSTAEIGRVMSVVGPAGGVVFVHAEDGVEVERLRAEAVSMGRKAPIEHARTRPARTEVEAVSLILDLVEKTRCPTVVVHVSCGETMELLAEARSRGLPVFGETCPHYLWLTERQLLRPFEEAIHYICSPPIRTASDAMKLWDGLCTGVLQFVATDHCPFSSEARNSADSFDKVPNGISGIGARFNLTFAGGLYSGRFGMERLAHVLSTHPAMICGLYPRKGVIAPGADADLVVVDPFGRTDLGEEPLAGACDFNPWEGIEAPGRLLAVMGRGEWLWREHDLSAKPGRGRFQERRRLSHNLLAHLLGKDMAWIYCP
ncbi:dihydropyrimidinase [Myxococcota bacterium]|nr:dihydropyrimidinase [Myxococcota bacterium]MBU1412099.1 dihydropyrimidinase [Myxococcota bacterium]MBU1510809.1 dihydropyrimidinase [Myxococcota bacterium]